MFEQDLQSRNALGTPKQGVEGGNTTEHLIAEKRQSLASGLCLFGRQSLANQTSACAALVEQHSRSERAAGDRHKNEDGNCGLSHLRV